MSVEPERPIEKLLRAFAKKRRGDARGSLELHPAARRQFQSEVAQRYAKTKPKLGWWVGLAARFRPRVVLGLAGSVVLVIALCLSTIQTARKKPETLLAKNERVGQRSSLPRNPALEVPAESASQTTSPLADSKQMLAQERDEAVGPNAKEREINERSLAAAEPVEQHAGQPATAAPVQAEAKLQEAENLSSNLNPGSAGLAANALVQDQYGGAIQNSPTAPGAPVSSLTSLALAPEARTPANNSQFQVAAAPALAFGINPSVASTNSFFRSYFVSVEQGAKRKDGERAGQASSDRLAKAAVLDKTSPKNPVLTSFQLEQSGQGLRVVDQDNSVYTGILETRTQADARSAPSGSNRLLQELARRTELRSETPSGMQSPRPAEYFFNVAGTNRSLNQRVVFFGSLVPNTNPTSLKTVSGLTSDASPTRGEEGGYSLFKDKRLIGTAVIGEGRQISIEAFPVSPQKENR